MSAKFSTKCTRDNLDKSVEFIFDDSEEKIEAKILRNDELYESEIISLLPRHHLLQKDSIWSIKLFLKIEI